MTKLKTIGHPLERLFRCQVHHFIKIKEQEALVLFDKTFFLINLENGTTLHHFPLYAKRPLALCFHENQLYYGEYKKNDEKGPIHLWRYSLIDKSYSQLWTFKNIRHVHGIFWDPYEEKFWVTTGDEDDESSLLIFDKDFTRSETILSGTQQARAIHLIFTSEALYFGSDTPLEKNFLFKMDRATKKVTTIQEVEGSVFWAKKLDSGMLFSTVVEPSSINTSKNANVWYSKEGKEWVKLHSFKKDFLHPRFFQYGQIYFPEGERGNHEYWISPFATEESGNSLLFRL